MVDALSGDVSLLCGREKARVNENLRLENLALTERNKYLRDNITYLLVIVSDLHMKVKDSENKMQSLVTALRLANSEESIHDENTHGNRKTQPSDGNNYQHMNIHT